ncbi:hypothetical protein GOP47_0010654 [Adiantum capillus-veneris]|uniref:Pentatricopeptide repeat-containing protein n=1 Tax=Adiantum capillus-veneris TaxID=13818 RepID=A0A9D4ZGJ7_ADICA|nr:hypothetical protein GOP47_0010654 [Adiantum capillus-veneris]
MQDEGLSPDAVTLRCVLKACGSIGAADKGYGQVRKHAIVFDLFNKMLEEGIIPNSVTFLVVLNSCGSLGFAKEGQMYFDMMIKNYGIVPNRDHCTCMVNLFGQSGHFDRALAVIKRMLSSNHLTMWYVLMNACQKWGNVFIGGACSIIERG